jgi:hypothetical protein
MESLGDAHNKIERHLDKGIIHIKDPEWEWELITNLTKRSLPSEDEGLSAITRMACKHMQIPRSNL